jgi:hypothetical protein
MREGNAGATGTRFRLFPRPPFLHPDWPPELVHVSTPPHRMGPGPSDDRIFVIDPIGKRTPYGPNELPFARSYLDLPPWRGPIRPPALPDAEGHFDYLDLNTPEFEQAHAYGTARFVLDIWERYLGGPFEWHFAQDYARLEIILLPSLDNAQIGYGFMQIGAHPQPNGALTSFALNFDVVAHELGHLIVYGIMGVPSRESEQGEYLGFQESAADTVALIAAGHFENLVDRLLEDTSGNLFSFNELNRFAQLSATTQIRLASNSVKLSQFAGGWHEEHDLSQPLTGALFDIFVDIFQENLVEQGLIDRSVADLSDSVRDHPEYMPQIQAAFDEAYSGNEDAFRAALIEARDYLGRALAETWKRLSPHFLSYVDVAELLLAVDRELSGGRYRDEMIESFDWRDIGRVTVGPRLGGGHWGSHSHSARTIVPSSVGWNFSQRLPGQARPSLASIRF